ncbi:MAG: ATP-NAD kinase family protein [Porticoccus sp.]|nr:ATP-NAD kinase family protein [Porticoccus sp.]
MFRLGLIINPLAGIGGPVALKGSDGAATVTEALSRGAQLRAPQRALRALSVVLEALGGKSVSLTTYPGPMGEDIARESGFYPDVIGDIDPALTTSADTKMAAKTMADMGLDMILFVGGDGTARNICDAIPAGQPVLGIPAGVKMHSGVYAISPEIAGKLIGMLARGELVDIRYQEVRDIDESAFRNGKVQARYYGDLLVPEEGRYMQHVKSGGREVESLVLEDIAATLIEEMEDDDALYIIGPGSTTRGLMELLGLENTLLGVDLIKNQELLALDVTATDIEKAITAANGVAKIVITPIGGQGHLLGRGNQQLTPSVIQRVGRKNLRVVATKTKIAELNGRPLLVDSNDPVLDRELSGYIPVITGYRDKILYPIG